MVEEKGVVFRSFEREAKTVTSRIVFASVRKPLKRRGVARFSASLVCAKSAHRRSG